MENASKIPPGNMEKARLGPLKAWLIRCPTDGATGECCRESLGGASLVYALTCRDLQLGSGTWKSRNNLLMFYEPLVDFSSVNSSSCFSKPSEDLQL